MKTKRSRSFVPAIAPLFLAVVVATVPSAASAQQGPTQGYMFRERPHLYFGVEGSVFAVAKQVTDGVGFLGHGGGGGLFVGYRVGPYIDLEFNLNITYHNQQLGTFYQALNALYLMNAMFDLKVHIPGGHGPMDPFFQAGAGYGYLGATYADVCGGFTCDTTFAQGPAFEVGGGFDYWLNPWISFGAKLLYRAIYFNSAAYQSQSSTSNFVNGFSIAINGTFHFF